MVVVVVAVVVADFRWRSSREWLLGGSFLGEDKGTFNGRDSKVWQPQSDGTRRRVSKMMELALSQS